MKTPTTDEIANMDYSTLVSLLDERNRCSGGIKSVHEIVIHSRLNTSSSVLEIGCNTGFTSVNLAYLAKCKVIGIDINSESINKARDYAKRNGLANKVNFIQANATNIPFPDETFDLIWASNVTSFIASKDQAIREYLRVLKIGGTLAVIPIYYRRKPPAKLIREVSCAINAPLEITAKEQWAELFEKTAASAVIPMQQYYETSYGYQNAADRIPNFVRLQLSKEHIKSKSPRQKREIKKRVEYFYQLFNRNLRYCGFSIFLYQRRHEIDEKELFISEEL